MRKIKWADWPEHEDYDAATSYLSLLIPPAQAEKHVQKIADAEITYFKAKDILRASMLHLLPSDDPKVVSKAKKIAEGEELYPVLLLRTPDLQPLIIADGWHRVNAVYRMDTEAEIPVQIADLDLTNAVSSGRVFECDNPKTQSSPAHLRLVS